MVLSALGSLVVANLKLSLASGSRTRTPALTISSPMTMALTTAGRRRHNRTAGDEGFAG